MSKAYDLVIKGGTVIDGARHPRFRADIGVRDGVIAKIGAIPADQGRTVIDAEGLIVAPGVVDTHTHYDIQVLWDPYCADSSWHGATTVVASNCGFGMAPCPPELRERYMLMMENTEQVPVAVQREVLSWDWETFPEWVEHLKRTPKAVNMAVYLPLNPLLCSIMGPEDAKTRKPTPAELAKMKAILRQSLDAGACGFSFSHLGDVGNNHTDYDGSPMPTDVMDVETAYELCEVLRERDQGTIQALVEFPFTRDRAHRREVVRQLAIRSGRPVLHNICLPIDADPDHHLDILRWLDGLEAEGVTNVYTQTVLGRKWAEFKIPDWTIWDGGGEEFREYTSAGDWAAKIRKASDPDWRARFRAAYDPDNMRGFGGALEGYLLRDAHGDPRYAPFEGRRLRDITAETGAHPADIIFDLVASTDGQADFVMVEGTSTDPVKAAETLLHKRTVAGISDGGAHVKVVNGGFFPTEIITWVAREHGLVSLEDAHYKLGNLNAWVMGFKDRGQLVEGFAADMMIYDYEKIDYDVYRQEAHFDMPDGSYRRLSRPRGIHWVIVNGEPILKDTRNVGPLPGKMISNGGRALDDRLSILGIAAE